MIIQADVKGLEVVAAAFLSQDEVMCHEILTGVDIHGENQKAFNLPSRLIAKKFTFRLIYGGTCYAYAKDPEFEEVGKNAKQWQEVIDAYYNKYEGLGMWHQYLIHEATSTGQIVIPTGRFFKFQPYEKYGELSWPITKIKNYPVQGLGADLVCLARVEFFKLFKEHKINGVCVSSIHDSIVADIDSTDLMRTALILKRSVSEIPKLFESRFGSVFNLPLSAEILIGPNCADMEEFIFDNT